LLAVTLGSKIAAKSVHFLLFTLVTIGNSGSRRSACSAVCCQAQWHSAAIGWGQPNDRLAG